MTPESRTSALKARALALGFAAVGIATLEPNAHAEMLERWLGAGHAGTMQYLHRQKERRQNPAAILPGARTAIVTLTNYYHGAQVAPGARVAQYAWSPDYHVILSSRLDELAREVRALAPDALTRCYVDAGPVPERELAQRAGLGWIGKNMMLIHPALGSFTFIGVVLTDAELVPDLPFEADRCGTCRRCLDACPTHAFVEPRVMDARRCISYLTIEQADLGDWLFGCDVCQDVCPWNVTFARATADPAFASCAELAAPDLDAFGELTPAAFDARFGHTPFERPGREGMRRNAAAVRASQAARAP